MNPSTESLWRPPFSEDLLHEAQRLADEPIELSSRSTFNSHNSFAIDDPETTEIDDAIQLVKQMPWGWRVAIHIANPGALVQPNSLLDAEARERGTTLYLPEQKILLFPSPLSEGAMSLLPGQLRPALSFVFDVTRDGELQNTSIQLTQVSVSARLTYEEVNAQLSQKTELAQQLNGLHAAAEALRQRREENGANSFSATEFLPYLVGEEVFVKRYEPSAARVMVSELMIAANTVAAQMLAKTRTPAVYRSQTRLPATPTTFRMSKPELSIAPKPHAGLGVSLYLQVTSPIRRYNDLILQRQLMSLLRQEPPVYEASQLLALSMACERRTMQARKLEASSRQYWMLKYFSQRIGEEVSVVVTQFEASDEYHVEIKSYGVRGLLTCKRLLQPGEQVQATIQKVSHKIKTIHLNARG